MAKKKKEEDIKLDKKYTDEEVKEATKKAKKDIFMEYAPYIMIIICIILIRTFIATPVRVQGSSMVPTLYDGDTMILYKLRKSIKGLDRFDIVVVKTDSGRLIKRVIGKPGDTVRYEQYTKDDGVLSGKLYINDKVVAEDFLNDNAKYETCLQQTKLCTEKGVKLKKGEYYVMGDNRGHSKDSRLLGAIPYDDIMGTTKLIIFPFDRIGSVD